MVVVLNKNDQRLQGGSSRSRLGLMLRGGETWEIGRF